MTAYHQRYLTFFANEYLKFTCMPNSYGPAMTTFTKITKVPFSVLRMQGHISVLYVDNFYFHRDSYENCLKNVNDKIIMLQSLGYTIILKTSWHLFVDGVQLSRGYRATTRRQFLPFSSQEFLVLS